MLRFVPAAAVLMVLPFSAAAGSPPFSFYTRTDLATPASVAVVSADFNGDGIADLAVLGASSVEIFLGKGDRRFASPMSVHLSGLPQSFDALAVADIDGDGKPDLVVSGSSSLIYFGNGDGTFTAGPTLAVAGLPVLAADFNLDGKPDLAFASYNGINVVLGDGKGGFSPPVLLPGAVGCLAVGDANGDGKPDVIGCGLNSVLVFLGNGDGTFRQPITSPIPSSAIFATAGDLNNDGKLDVAAVATHDNGSDPNLGPVYVLYGNGDGSFQPALQVHTNIGPLFSVGIGDLNGDGLPDLVAASIGGLPGAPFVGSLVGTYLNQGAGQGFAQDKVYPVTFANELPWAAMLVADLTGDQRPEIVVTNGGGSAYFSVLFNDGTGGFKDVRSVSLPGNSAAGVLYGSPVSVAQADFNGDGLGDLAFLTAHNGHYELKVFFGTGKSGQPFLPGTSTVLAPTRSSFEPISMVAADFNGDGQVDVAISYTNLFDFVSFVQVYLGNGDGTFRAGGHLGVPMAGAQMIAADFNGDGKLDLASSSGFVALGNGDGTFRKATMFYQISPLANTFGVWLAATDFNHDGKLDLAFQTPENVTTGQPLLIFAGNGDGTFQNPVSYTWGYLPVSGAIADLNGDGNPDIVILSGASGRKQKTAAVFLGNPDGSFQAPSYIHASFTVSPLAILAGDFNGDGKMDVAVMDSGGNAIHLFAGNGDGAFGPDVEVGAASTMLWIGSGNYGGQTKPGYPDLLTFDGGPNTFFTPSNPAAVAISMLWNAGWQH
jgi:hypothetical protein